jgi:hypothetical protein
VSGSHNRASLLLKGAKYNGIKDKLKDILSFIMLNADIINVMLNVSTVNIVMRSIVTIDIFL